MPLLKRKADYNDDMGDMKPILKWSASMPQSMSSYFVPKPQEKITSFVIEMLEDESEEICEGVLLLILIPDRDPVLPIDCFPISNENTTQPNPIKFSYCALSIYLYRYRIHLCCSCFRLNAQYWHAMQPLVKNFMQKMKQNLLVFILSPKMTVPKTKYIWSLVCLQII